MTDTPAGPADREIRLWDRPVRLIHWGFVLLVPALWATAETGRMDWHRALGLVTLALLLLRLYWGIFGSQTARFASFVCGPRAVIAYLRHGKSTIGHNPLGALSVIALLGLLALQIGLGLFAQDSDAIISGPLSHLVSFEIADAATEWHERLFNLLLAAIALHVGAILYYLLVRRDNLVRPMLTGRKRTSAAQPVMGSARAAAIGVVASIALTLWIAAGAPLP